MFSGGVTTGGIQVGNSLGGDHEEKIMLSLCGPGALFPVNNGTKIGA